MSAVTFHTKPAAGRAGYALGFERPFFGSTKLYVGGELHDLTASDDQWQVSSLEASLAAVGPRLSYRDYYRRRGVQINAAVRINPHVEALFAWRGERQESLTTSSDFSVWNSDQAFKPNVDAREGRLNALVVGASVDGRGFDRESLERDLPPSSARDAVRRTTARPRRETRHHADLAYRLDIGDLDAGYAR